jgi:arabinan endo-1,5-alpha-L-arabinosidase
MPSSGGEETAGLSRARGKPHRRTAASLIVALLAVQAAAIVGWLGAGCGSTAADWGRGGMTAGGGRGGASAAANGAAGANAGGGTEPGTADGSGGQIVGGAVGGGGGRPACQDLGGGPLTTSTTHLDITVHDPSMIWDGSAYALFSTGGTLAIRRSVDILRWTASGTVLSAVPAWIHTTLGVTVTDLWAPDISYFNCTFHVYYAGSTFGSNNSVIGLATSPTLDSSRAGYHWTDEGQVLRSVKTDDFNAIDPNVSFDDDGTPWLAYGSYWTGIKLHQLDRATGKLSTTNTTTYALASRNGGSIEGSSIVSHDGHFYLFVSFGTCCAGVNSTYETMVGRASTITGPYTDRAGADMMTGAAEQLLATSGRYIGPGGGTAFRDGSSYVYAYHYYDGDANGVSKLQIRPINWDASGWPVMGTPLFP